MSTQLLFYSSASPITLQRHRDWGVESAGGFGFASHTNSVPLMAVEFAKAAGEYAIIFAGNDSKVMPAAVLGIQNDTNVYVDAAGEWTARYIPAFVRRYPFVFSSADDGKTFTLCIDEGYVGANPEARGNRLFTEDGERTDYLNGVLRFLKEYQTEYNRSQLLCDKLVELDLLEPMQAQIKLKSGKQLSLTGFQSVSREKLNSLEPQTLSELARSGALELIYIHLYSMTHFADMMEKVAQSMATDREMSLADVEPGGNA
ncbi:MAG: SapC family protein [Oceanospirillaceae bacterium]|nr:SapC family protein [Oceanospirillaceae bacterium]